MKALSRWAKNNPNPARVIIALSHLLAVINAVFFGLLIFSLDWVDSTWWLVIFANIFFISYVFYPQIQKNKTQHRPSYARQKMHDFSLVFCYSAVIGFGVNIFLQQSNQDVNSVRQPTAEFIAFRPGAAPPATHAEESSATNLKDRIPTLRRQIRHELKELRTEIKRKNHRKGSTALMAVLILLTVLAAAFLAALVAALACNLSCSGQEGLAVVVLILGLGGLVWLLIIAIKGIMRKFDEPANIPDTPGES